PAITGPQLQAPQGRQLSRLGSGPAARPEKAGQLFVTLRSQELPRLGPLAEPFLPTLVPSRQIHVMGEELGVGGPESREPWRSLSRCHSFQHGSPPRLHGVVERSEQRWRGGAGYRR